MLVAAAGFELQVKHERVCLQGQPLPGVKPTAALRDGGTGLAFCMIYTYVLVARAGRCSSRDV